MERVHNHTNGIDYIWTVNVDTLEQLVELSKKERLIIIGDAIVIYDRYRE